MFAKEFRRGAFRLACVDKLIEQQKQLIPDTLVYIEQIHQRASMHHLRMDLQGILHTLLHITDGPHLDNLFARAQAIREQLAAAEQDISNQGEKKEIQKKSTKCPWTGCKGYIFGSIARSNDSDPLISKPCSICATQVCRDCNTTLGPKDAQHKVCDAELKSNWQFILRNSKPCPKCGTPIEKISGCNQMWCTAPECHTAFDWISGHVIDGPFHNPHYHDYLRNNTTRVVAPVGPNCQEITLNNETVQHMYNLFKLRYLAGPKRECAYAILSGQTEPCAESSKDLMDCSAPMPNSATRNSATPNSATPNSENTLSAVNSANTEQALNNAQTTIQAPLAHSRVCKTPEEHAMHKSEYSAAHCSGPNSRCIDYDAVYAKYNRMLDNWMRIGLEIADDYFLSRFRTNGTAVANSLRSLRIRYIQNNITERRWKISLSLIETLRIKMSRIYAIRSMYRATFTDIVAQCFISAYRATTGKTIQNTQEYYTYLQNTVPNGFQLLDSLNAQLEELRVYYIVQSLHILQDYSDQYIHIPEYDSSQVLTFTRVPIGVAKLRYTKHAHQV